MAKERSEFLEKIDTIFAENQDNQNEELMFTYKGVLYPSRLCSAKTFEALEIMEARKDDMLIATYPKCGTNWTVQILNGIVAARYEDFQEQFILQMLDFGTPEKFQMLVIFRNPKGTAVSYYHFYNKHPLLPTASSWDDFFQKFMSGEGEVGDWKTLFTEAQSQEMDTKFEECLAGTKLGAKLKYDEYCKF